MRDIKQIRAKDVAFDNEETLIGVSCIAAPIRSSSNEIPAAISISGPKYRMSKAKTKQFASLLSKAAKEISMRLGFEG